jgi:hypothetical protein
MLIDHMSKGFSFESFAGIVETDRQTIYNWTDKHPEFFDAKKEAFEKSRVFWEEAALKGLWNDKDGPQLNNTIWIFNMKNRFGWKDKVEVEETGTKEIKISIDSDDEEL